MDEINKQTPDVNNQSPSNTGATDNVAGINTGALDIKPEVLAGLPEPQRQALTDYVNNIKQMQSSSTQKYQEAADMRRQVEAERNQVQELMKQAEYLREQQETWYQNMNKPKPENNQPPSFNENPEAAYTFQSNRVQELEKKIQEFGEKWDVAQYATKIERFYADEIKPKFPDVSLTELRVYFMDRPDVPLQEKSYLQAAQEIQNHKNTQLDERYKKYIQEKEAVAQKSAIQPGANLGALPPGKGYGDLSDAERNRLIMDDLRNMGIYK